MKIFVFDTETTGFIDKKENNIEKQPRIVQFAGIFGDFTDNIFKQEKLVNIMVNPKIPIPYGSSEVHHIYDIDIKNSPYIEDVIDEIMKYINESDVIIGHNIEYDESIIKLELSRLKKDFLYKPKQICCTMKETVDFCSIKGMSERFKYPKLGELHKKLFGEYFIGAHNAITDVEATLKCFLELANKKVINLKENKNEILSLF